MKPFSFMQKQAEESRGGGGWKCAVLSGAMVAIVGLTGCETPGQTALAGAAAGAAIGGAIHVRGEDALKGAAIGAGAGYLAGRHVQNERERAYREGYYDSRYSDNGHYSDRRVYTDRYGEEYYIGRDGRRHYVN
jgi:hypothetical protein